MLLVLLVLPAFAQQKDPASLPAREEHAGLLVAADPYDDAQRSKERFGKKHPFEAGILALEVYFRNDTDKAIRVDLSLIRLVLEIPDEGRQRLMPLSVEDVVNAIVYKEGIKPTVPRKPRPSPLPRSTGRKDKEVKQVDDVLRPLAFEMDVLPPRAILHGLFFFHLDHRFDLLRYAQLYIPDLKFLPDDKPLMFFEVDLSKTPRK